MKISDMEGTAMLSKRRYDAIAGWDKIVAAKDSGEVLEGKVVEVAYKGSVENVIMEILGGVRSTMSYIGARRLKDIPKCTTFYRVNRQLNEVFGKS